MRTMWRLLTTLFAVAGFLSLAGGGFMWQQGLLRVGAQEQAAEKSVDGSLPPPPKVGPDANAKAAMSVDEAKAWEKRLEDMRRDIDKKQKDLDLSKDVLATQKLLLGDVATALAALVGQLTGEVPALQLGSKNRVRPEDVDKKLEELGKSGVSDATVQSLAADRSALDGAMRKLAERTSREKRMPELKATIVEMEPKDAAALLGTAIKPEAAAELLLALTAEERASILAAMVKQNPATAGELFTRLGAVDVKSDKNAGTESAPQSALDAAKGKKG